MTISPEFWRWRQEDQFKVILSYTLQSKFKAFLNYMRPEGEKE